MEIKGIFVQCFIDVPVELVRGFSLYYDGLPVIGINNEDCFSAKSFSLIHELVHLLKRESSVCNVMFDITLSRFEKVFCNAVAGELLVPQNILKFIITNGKI